MFKGPPVARKGKQMSKTLFALSLGFVAVIMATQAYAQSQCADRDSVIATLAQDYAEARRGIGLAANNAVVEVYASDAGSWSIIVTLPDGPTCLIASGVGYESLSDALPAKGDPA